MTRQANLAGISVPETLANIDSAATLRVICPPPRSFLDRDGHVEQQSARADPLEALKEISR